MKRNKRLFLTIAVMLGLLAMLQPLYAAAGDKVTICHKPGTPDEVTITVSVNALEAHLAHGDYQGVCTQTTVLTCPFDVTAIPVIGPDPVNYVVEFPPPSAGYGWDVVVWSSTGQDYLLFPVPSGSPPPPLDEFIPIPGEQVHIGWPGPDMPSVWDFYVAKMYPEDTNFEQMVECIQAESPSP